MVPTLYRIGGRGADVHRDDAEPIALTVIQTMDIVAPAMPLDY
ncbi:hypothetical protein RB3963 [Rhodopirellula baltica SH 1]|uniref:Uncharacterized protein n=1 Tax=Rhodopirellula baltica (strain DSM 10527 / NCIMB 13988 / SH1) TaxID=243090 RepID=Q7UTC6_RHOBA|nr:hypothetical protein RB3963 [Rhodopirellula baltica SH 1]